MFCSLECLLISEKVPIPFDFVVYICLCYKYPLHTSLNKHLKSSNNTPLFETKHEWVIRRAAIDL